MSANVVLIGPMAAGKTKIGKIVAPLLGLPRFDTDKMFVAAHGPITEFFAERGEAEFRAVEADLVQQALSEDAVVSLGGGAVLDKETRNALASLPVVYLTVSTEAVAARLGEGKRPLLADDGVVAWERIFEARKPIYEALAKRTYDTSRGNLEAIGQDIAAWVSSGYVHEQKAGL